MQSKRQKQLYNFIIILLGIVALFPLMLLSTLTRNELITHIIILTNKPYLANLLSNKIITPQKFLIIHYSIFAFITLDFVVVFLFYYFRDKVLSSIQFIVSTLTSCFLSLKLRNNTKQENVILLSTLSIIFIKGCYYMSFFDLQYDEMWSYNYFTSRPFYLTFFSYNNYPLYELSTHIFKWLPFSMKINLRLPPLLMGLCSMYVLFGCTRKYTASFATALSAVVFFACMPVSVFYMLYARGVMFELFFAITAFFSILFLLKTKKVKKYSFLFIASNVLGMYSMPSHLYFWATLSLVSLFYFILYEKELIKSFLISNLLILLLSILCYLPVLCGSGLSFILDATYNNIPSTNAVTNILFYSNGISNFFTSSPYGLLCLFIVSLAILVLCKKVGKGMLFLIVFAFILFLLPTFIYLIQHTFVPERALAFIGLVIPLLGCSVFYVFKNTFRQYSLYTTLVVLFLCGSFVSHKHDYLNWSVQKDRKAIVLSDLFMKEKIETCYDNAPNSDFYYFYPSLEYYFGEHKKLIQFNVAASNSLRYKQLSENDKYDCIIDSISADEKTRILKYKKIYADEMDGFKVWRLK